MDLVAGLTLLIAGCSFAVAFSGGIVERKRPFTLLRVTGTPVRALYRVVLLETVVPLLSATVSRRGGRLHGRAAGNECPGPQEHVRFE